ncbi:IS66 family insertion sequence element accessory protein TnpB [Caballeronia mineralivorans]|uniref:IS66 family insertion sequence element accessory protein TnpB n=1 Tax=Caballeronia mineralivorans TaxID=2010198 RepID=UPI0023F287A8|nr:IS66 family insertion sequence element accessory protein TnpB [Caballeronia mineralivorans]MDB5788651.1 transposase [Caballeronia mineralivorans]
MLIASDVRAYICRDPVDMRKAIDGLSYLVEPLLAQKPASGNLFVFVARDRSKVKVLYWDRTDGFESRGCPVVGALGPQVWDPQ